MISTAPANLEANFTSLPILLLLQQSLAWYRKIHLLKDPRKHNVQGKVSYTIPSRIDTPSPLIDTHVLELPYTDLSILVQAQHAQYLLHILLKYVWTYFAFEGKIWKMGGTCDSQTWFMPLDTIDKRPILGANLLLSFVSLEYCSFSNFEEGDEERGKICPWCPSKWLILSCCKNSTWNHSATSKLTFKYYFL